MRPARRLVFIPLLLLAGAAPALGAPGAAAPATAAPRAAEPVAVELSAAASGLTVREAIGGGGAGLRLVATVGRLEAAPVRTPAGPFVRLDIPGQHATVAEGRPRLPLMNRLLWVPAGARVRVEARSLRERRLGLDRFGLAGPLAPAQAPRPKGEAPAAPRFALDRSAYAVDRVARPLARAVPLGRLRGSDLVRLEVAPVEYLPAEAALLVHEAIEVAVLYEGGDPALRDRLVAATASPFLPGPTAPDGLAAGCAHLAIVAPPEFVPQLAELVRWKTERGFLVTVGTVGSAGVGETAESIRGWLRDLYDGATAARPAPSFVLLVGDVEQVPTFLDQASGSASDRPYAALDGDQLPDACWGRLPARDGPELQAMLAKTLAYDRCELAAPDSPAAAVLIAGVDSTWSPTHANGQVAYARDTYFDAAHGLDARAFLHPESGSSEPQILAALAAGAGFVNYTGHGTAGRWSEPRLTQDDVRQLTGGATPVVVANCCESGRYDEAECFGETWLRVPAGGAVAYLGASSWTYWDEDYWWSVGYTAHIGPDQTFATTGAGAFDGLFHDHGEPIERWYASTGAVAFAGNLAVMESGSSRADYYWSVYNLLGDPSLLPWLGEPAAGAVVHPEALNATATSLSLVAVPGSYVGLTQGGELLAGGAVGADGTATLDFRRPLAAGVPLHLVVTGQGRRPYQADLPVAAPARAVVAPASVPVDVTTEVALTVLDEDGVTPLAGIEVRAEGLGWSGDPAVTDAAGRATLAVRSPYGPSCLLLGRRPGQTDPVLRVELPVEAPAIAGADLWLETGFGFADAAALGLPALLRASLAEPGAQLHAFLPDGSEVADAGTALNLTPRGPGEIRAVLAVRGRDLYEETFPVVEAFGTLQGRVTCDGAPVAGARVEGLDAGGLPLFAALTAADGSFKTGPVLAGEHTLSVACFGYATRHEQLLLWPEAARRDVELAAAPRGVLAGEILDDAAAPLTARVTVRRADTGELVAEVVADRLRGRFETPPLPRYAYLVRCSAHGHLPAELALELASDRVEKRFELPPARADVLILDDGPQVESVLLKREPAAGAGDPGAKIGTSRSAPALAADLGELGFAAEVVPAAAADPALWGAYDLVVLAAGGSDRPLLDRDLRDALASLVDLGRSLLLEGGELGYVHAGAPFGRAVLHADAWLMDGAGEATVLLPDHPLASRPNRLPASLPVACAGYSDGDAVTAGAGGTAVLGWSDRPDAASVLVHDPNSAPDGGQIVYLGFNYAVADPAGRRALLENAVVWLTTAEDGGCSLSGVARLEGGAPAAAARITVLPGGGITTAGADGAFTVAGLFPGTYTVRAEKDGWLAAEGTVQLAAGQQVADLALELPRPRARILLVDDAGKPGTLPPKLDPDSGDLLADGYAAGGAAGSSGDAGLAGDLAALGYGVTVRSPAGTDAATWALHDLVVISCGGNPEPLADAGLRAAVTARIAAGRGLLVEGGEVGYAALRQPGYPVLAAALRLAGWQRDDAGDLLLAGDHPLLRQPNRLEGTAALAGAGYADRDAIVPSAAGTAVGGWSDAPGATALAAFDPDPDREGGQVLVLGCNAALLPQEVRRPLLENAVTWLTAGAGEGSLAGRVRVQAGSGAGVLVRADPGGHGCLTDADGRWRLERLPAGRYTVRAVLPGHAAPPRQVQLPPDRHVASVDFDLGLVAVRELCAEPALPIPDGDAAGILSHLGCDAAGYLAAIACEVEIVHPWRGDLVVDLVAPGGASVRLHDRSGGGQADLAVVYASDPVDVGLVGGDGGADGDGVDAPPVVPPDGPGSLADLAGLDPRGTWRLRVVDAAGGDAGTLVRWCLRLSLADRGFAGGPPAGPVLHPNYPNPFNPETSVRFDLPQAGPVRVRVYDVAGRLVRDLLRQTLPAGAHVLAWDGRDDAGRPVASGLYHCRLEAAGAVRSRKMLLLR